MAKKKTGTKTTTKPQAKPASKPKRRKIRYKFEILSRHESGPFDRKKDEATEELATDPIEAVCHARIAKGDVRIRAHWRDPETNEKKTSDFSATARDRAEWRKIIHDRAVLNRERTEMPERDRLPQIPAWPWIEAKGFREWHGFLEFCQDRGIGDPFKTQELHDTYAEISGQYAEEDVDFQVEEAPTVASQPDPRHAPNLDDLPGDEEDKEESNASDAE